MLRKGNSMRTIHIIMTLLLFTLPVFAQNGSWWESTFPVSGDTITIYFDPTQNNEIPNNVSSLVLHWGVNESGTGNWQAPPVYLWPPGTVLHTDGIAARSPMTQVSANLWQIVIPTDSTILSLHYVVNDGTPSNPGAHWGHNTGGGNWNITLYQSLLSAVILEPQVNNYFGHPQRSPAFAQLEDTVHVMATAVTIGTQIFSLELFIDNTSVSQVFADTLTYDFIAENWGVGFRQLMVVAVDTAFVTDTTLFLMLVNPPIVNSSVPAGIVDGINYLSNTSVTLSLFAPYKSFVYVIGDFNDWMVDTSYFMKREEVNPDSVRYWLTIEGLTPGEEYAFQYLVDGKIRIADPYTDKILDPWNDQYIPANIYPNLKPYPDGKTKEPVSVLQTDQMPFTWVYSDTFQRVEKKDLVIYELLVRDFLNEHDYTTLADTLAYFEKLGIKAIELMPISEFEGNSSWGYNPSFYFAPDKYYGPKNDLKSFIDECHKHGIAVIMDMVLNHSYGQSPLVRLYWDSQNNRPSAENPWYNQVSPNPVYAWGFDFNHQSKATKIFVDRVNHYWLSEYKVDGFRFDFTKGFTNTPGDGQNYDSQRISILERMADKIWEYDTTAYIILEHFTDNSEEKVLAEYRYGMMLWGNLNYSYNQATMGYNGNNESDFSRGYYGTRNWTKPHLVTYMESHDEERLMYKNVTWGNDDSVSYYIKDTTTALQRIKMAGAFFFTYPGPKMIWQFGELGYDYSIDYNGRLGEKPIRWDYLNQDRREKLYKTFAALLKLRKENEVFRNPKTQVELWLNDQNGGKRIRLMHTSMNVSIIGNFGVAPQETNPNLIHPGWWYDFFSGDSFSVAVSSKPVNLQPGEFHIYTDHKLETPEPGLVTNIAYKEETIPLSYHLWQNYPNPFNPSTNIQFELPRLSKVNLVIFDLLGRKVKTLVDKSVAPGKYEVQWDGLNEKGVPVSSGIYILHFRAGTFEKNRRIILLK
jgi:1,4-alpha-glucan branching enzyme